MQLMQAIANGPSWSDNAISENWDELSRALPAEWLPEPTGKTELTGRTIYKTYGCGNYGCVYPTGDPDAVFKITSDATEADFVSSASQFDWPAGIVRYYVIYEVQGRRKRSRAGSVTEADIFAIVRESAEYIGKVRERPHTQTLVGLVKTFKEIASQLRRVISETPGALESAAELQGRIGRVASGLRRLADVAASDQVVRVLKTADAMRIREGLVAESSTELVLVLQGDGDNAHAILQMHSALEDVTSLMRADETSRAIGYALRYYLDRGLLLADVHLKNVGVVHRPGGDIWAITDPGHLVRLRSDIARVEIPTL